MPTTGYKDTDGVDVGNKYVTKDYMMEFYSDLVPALITPELKGFGENNYGQLGTNTTINYSSPVTTVSGGTNWKQISIGSWHSSGIKTDGSLWCWGYNGFGELGDNSTSNKSSPVSVSGGGTNWKQVSCSYSFSVAAVKIDGTLWTWGKNNLGQLGSNDLNSRSSPATIYGGGTNWKQISCNYDHMAGVKTDGTLWVWGYNINGGLGTNNTTNYSSPVTVSGGGTNWNQVSCGQYYTAAIKTDGTLWVWGRNNVFGGALGTYNTSNYSSPVTTSGGGTNWKQVSCAQYHTAAIKADGTLWVCGYNSYGQLGTNSLINYSSPVTTSGGGTNWKQVSVANRNTAAIKADGTLWTWGDNAKGQLGINTVISKRSPVTVSGGGTNWKSVVCGYYSSLALSESQGW